MNTTENPFKFGGVVGKNYFTNRKNEIEQLKNVLNSQNHVTIISPRRFGKTSLVYKVVAELDRPLIDLNLQMVTSIDDFARQLLKRVFSQYPFEKVKQGVTEFKFIPSLSINLVTNETDINFNYNVDSDKNLEDVLNLINKLASPEKKPIVVFDEFQEIIQLNKDLPKILRSIVQHHTNINYIFLGSQESLIRNMFIQKKSPFYHFGMLMYLNKIPKDEFYQYLENRLLPISAKADVFSTEILAITEAHPYYTQQLAFTVWNEIRNRNEENNVVNEAVNSIVQMHDLDYERQWISLNQTDKKVLIGLAESIESPLSEKFAKRFNLGASSTTFSSLKRLMNTGLVIKLSKGYELDDPFMKRWIIKRRN